MTGSNFDAANGQNWFGSLYLSHDNDEEPYQVELRRRVVDGRFRAAAVFAGSPDEDAGSQWAQSRRALGCRVETGNGSPGPPSGYSNCGGGELGLRYAVSKTSARDAYRVAFFAGTDLQDGQWMMRIGRRHDGADKHIDAMRQVREGGPFSMNATLDLPERSLLYVSTRGPRRTFCRMTMRRDW